MSTNIIGWRHLSTRKSLTFRKVTDRHYHIKLYRAYVTRTGISKDNVHTEKKILTQTWNDIWYLVIVGVKLKVKSYTHSDTKTYTLKQIQLDKVLQKR